MLDDYYNVIVIKQFGDYKQNKNAFFEGFRTKKKFSNLFTIISRVSHINE